MNTRISLNDTFDRRIVANVQQIRKFVKKHSIREFIFPTGRRPVNTITIIPFIYSARVPFLKNEIQAQYSITSDS